METLGERLGLHVIPTGPYLLGKSIEWKLRLFICGKKPFTCPYLLGKSIEWKPQYF